MFMIQSLPGKLNALENIDHKRGIVPTLPINEGRYSVRLATKPAEVEAALRLRFEVFNLELNEGLESSYITGLDEDEYDASCDHLILIENATGQIVGTYRLRTLEIAGTAGNFYTAGQFDIESLPIEFLQDALEIGRASISIEHRNTKALYMLWKGLVAYLEIKNKRFLFGACSLNSQSPGDGILALLHILQTDSIDEKLWVKPHTEKLCRADDALFGPRSDYKLPKLFNAYLRFGARVCSPPAIDREFGTIDFLVVFDKNDLSEQHRRIFAGK
jgi:putative hemolysin